jgi:ribosomal protein S5
VIHDMKGAHSRMERVEKNGSRCGTSICQSLGDESGRGKALGNYQAAITKALDRAVQDVVEFDVIADQPATIS